MSTTSVRLALAGGQPAVPPGAHREWPDTTEADVAAVIEVLHAPASELGNPNSKFLRAVEDDFAEFSGVSHCLAVGSGSDALEAGVVSAGVKPGDKVIVPALSFGTGHAVLMAGAVPVWCDIDRRTFNLDLDQLDLDDQTRAIMPVHLHGLPVDMRRLRDIAGTKRRIIGDACQAAGATCDGEPVGSLGLAAGFSTNVQKPLEAGDGGLLTTNDADVDHAARLYTCFGEERVAPGPGEASAHWSRWFGRHSRMHPVAAALARSRLRRLPTYLATAAANAAILTAGLADLPGVEPPYVPPDRTSTYHLFRVLLDPEALGWEGSLRELRDRVIHALRAEGVPAGIWQSEPLPKLPVFRRAEVLPWSPEMPDTPLLPWDPSAFPVATRVLDGSIVLGRVPYPLQIQTEDLMRHYLNAFEKVIDGIQFVLSAPYEPLRIVPAIPAADL